MKNRFLIVFFFYGCISVFGQGEMTFQATITNKNSDVVSILENRKTIQEIKIDANGIFKATFPINEGLYLFFDGKKQVQLFLKPNYDLKMTADASNFEETVKFEGNGSLENNFMVQQTLVTRKTNFESLLALDEASFNTVFEERKRSELAKIEQAGLDLNFATMLRTGLLSSLDRLQKYHDKIISTKKLQNNKSASFDYANFAGGKTKLEDLKGKYVYIDVWATWCGPCRAEIPSLKKVEEKYQGKNIEFVSISIDVDKDFEKWKTVVKDKELGGIQLFADKNWNSDFIKAFGITSIPRFILIDPSGNVVDADVARPSDIKLQEKLDLLLK